MIDIPEVVGRSGAREAILTTASRITPEPISWLWHHRVPLGKLTLFIGDPGVGKSTLLVDLIARVTTGRSLPDGASVQRTNAIILSAEDGLADTIVPRLMVAGADLGRAHFLTAVKDGDTTQETVLPGHIDVLAEAADRMAARLIVIDSLDDFLTSAANSWRSHDVRRALRPLQQFAQEAAIAVVAIMHLSKGGGRPAMHRASGSLAYVAVARTVLLAAKDPNDDSRRILASVKSNLAPTPTSLAYRLVSADNDVAKVEWEGTSDITADQLVAEMDAASERGAVAEAKAFLEGELADGPVKVRAIQRSAKEAGFSRSTLKRARVALGLNVTKVGFGTAGAWQWALRHNNGDRDYTVEERAALGAGDA